MYEVFDKKVRHIPFKLKLYVVKPCYKNIVIKSTGVKSGN